MPARHVISAVLAAGACAAGAAAPVAANEPATRPNVVVVMTDDQTVEQVRAMKNVRRMLVERGTTFERSFASFPLCCPSRATYLTGQYTHNHGVRGNSGPEGGYYKLDSTNTLPTWLHDAGYSTAHIGKYLNQYGERDPREVPPGWDEWYGFVDPSARYFNFTLNENGRLKTYDDRARNYQSDVYTRKAVDFIGRRAPRTTPFFLSVGYGAPHGGGPKVDGDRCQRSAQPAPRHEGAFADAQLPKPPSFDEPNVSDKPGFIRKLDRLDRSDVRTIRNKYRCRRESLLAVDEGVKAIVDVLKETGERANTLIVFTSDNGYFSGEHRIRDGKKHHYEPSTRVPLVLRGPAIPSGAEVTDLVANIDLAPTIVDVAEATPGRVMDGRSLVPLAQRPDRFRSRDIVLQNASPGSDARYRAIRTGKYVYAEYESGERELYDLERDPFELHSRHADPAYAQVMAELALELDRLRSCSGPTCATTP